MGFAQNSLVSHIYELALGRSTWDSILDLLHAAFPGSVVVASVDDTGLRRNLTFSQRGLSSAGASLYASRHAEQSPYLPLLTEFPIGKVYNSEDFELPADASAAGYFSLWAGEPCAFNSLTGCVLLRDGGRHLSLEVRTRADDADVRQAAKQTLEELAPHFIRAFEILARSQFPMAGGYLDHIVEDLPFAMFILDAEMRIRYGNQQAKELRRAGDGPFAGGDGVLRARDEATDEQLRELVQRVLSVRRAAPSVSILSHRQEDRYFAIARPVSRTQHHYQLQDAILDPGPLAALVVHRSHEASALPLDMLWRAFGLTDAEARLAESLFNGATLADVAQDRAVSKQTLRNQLVGVMKKTGTRRQSELVSLLTRLSLTTI